MALNYKNHVVCSWRESQTLGRGKKATLRSHGCSLPIRAPRYNAARVTAVLTPPDRSHHSKGTPTSPLHAVASQLDAPAATNGRGESDHHDNHYTEPQLQPSTLTVHGGAGSI